jgi:deoxyribonuclease V
METGRRPDCGVCAAVDVHYLSTGGARAAAVLAADAAFAHVLAERTAVVPRVAPYQPGLGARAHAEFGIPVIGVAKSQFRTATHAVPVVRGSSGRPLFITAAGMPAADVMAQLERFP